MNQSFAAPPDDTSAGQEMGVLRWGGLVRAEIRALGRSMVSKSYSHTPFWFRQTLGRFLIRREASLGLRLAGLPGVTAFLERTDSYTLRFRRVSGQNILQLPAGLLDEAFFDHLQALLAHLREIGILHLDVARNVLRAEDGQPVLCDFATALNLSGFPSLLRKPLVRLREPYDLREISRLKKRSAPHLLGEHDFIRLERSLPLDRVFRPLVEAQKFVRRRLARLAVRGRAQSRVRGRLRF